MRIFFIYPMLQLNLAQGNTQPLPVLSLASFMKKRGHEVHIYERNISRESVLYAVQKFGPDVVVCTLMFAQQIEDAQKVCRKLRVSRPDLPILCGGLTASLIPELILREGLADYVGIGEGEHTLLELLEVVCGSREPSSVQSLAYLNQAGRTVHTPLRPFADLSDFPETDFSLLPMDKYFVHFPQSPRTLTVYASKGCPRQCTFCFNEAYHRCQYRARKRQSVMDEIEALVSKYGADGFKFVDELWGTNKEELRAYCNDIAALSEKLGKQIRWYCQTRIGTLHFEDLKRMADAGCFMVQFGLESGSPEILMRMKKGYPLESIETDFHNCKAAGIIALPFVIFGFPGETPAQIKQTVHTLFRLNPAIFGTGLFFVSPGSAEYNRLVASGRFLPPRDLSEWIKFGKRFFVVANYSAIPDLDLKVIHYFFYWQFLFKNQKNLTGNSGHVKLLLRRVAYNIGRKGFFEFCFSQALLVFRTAWYYYAFPGIRKKYDLFPRNFGRKDWEDLDHMLGSEKK